MKFRGQSAVTFVQNQSLSVEPDFAKHFNAVWVPNKLMLTLFNVTDAEEGQYCCEVITSGRSGRTWIRKIQLLVVDPSQATVSSIAVLQLDPIQTTVSGVTASEESTQLKRETTNEEHGQFRSSLFIIITFDKRQTMVSSTTVPQYPILTTESPNPNTAPEVGVPWGIILPVLGVATFIVIAGVCALKWMKRFKRVHNDGRNGGIEMRPRAGDALPGPPAADGINGSQSRTNIPG
ncbi:PREDICTED: uncharacterized protein LOC107336096 [Acropora digitifera]|uniref:uncharacterized protein LOC107336096 n=1 Tax=Acropora digitifera TaxID=70779 RepID=UPI00077B2584|nr:PREDICTED: uncharacterized protein LOC107336096 [Acropora digitifera]